VTRRLGFSLVEVLVASGVLVAVFLPIMFTFTQTVRQAEVSLDELEATLLADELADQLQLIPYVYRFERLIAFPAPNPPPAYSRWATLTTTGSELPEGRAGLIASLDTGGGKTLGEPLAGDEAALEDRPYTRLYVSPVGQRFRRFFKVHKTLDRTGSLEESDHLTEVEVKVEWDGLEIGAKRTREVIVRGIVSDPRMVVR
jgi:hypothetical protein